MNNKTKTLLITIFINFLLINLFSDNIKFRHLTTDDGLSQNSIYTFFQDSKGFIWIGTADGLNKYDGYNFEVFRHSPRDPDSINGGWITAMIEDQDGMIWIGSSGGGLGKLNPGNKKTIKYFSDPNNKRTISDNYILSISKSKNGDIWIGTRKGLNIYNHKTNSFQRIIQEPNNSSSLSNNFAKALYYDGNNMWIGTGNGLNKYNIKKKTFKSYKKTNKNSLSNNSIRCIYKGQDNMLWIGTANGLNKFDPVNEQFIHYYVKEKPNEFNGNYILDITESNNKIWFTAYRKGLYSLDKKTGIIKNYKNDVSDPQSLINDQILTIFKDRSGLIWVGTWANDLSFFHPDNQFKHYYHKRENKNSLSTNEIIAICEDNKKNIWLGLFNGGMNRFNPKKNLFKHYFNNPENINSISSNRVSALTYDKNDILWIGYWNSGISRYDVNNNVFRHYYYNKKNINSLSSNTITKILIDKEENLWITTTRGLNKFNKKTKTFNRFLNDINKNNSLVNNYINDIIEDRNDLWIGTALGLSKMDKNRNSFINYRPTQKERTFYVRCILNESENHLWLGTRYRGLVKFDKRTGDTKSYTIENGLPSNSVVGILKDRSNNLWLSTKNGLVKFNIKNEKIQIYKKSDGIQSNEFLQNIYLKSTDGMFYFGGNNGLTAFRPEKIKKNHFSPPVIITSITIYPKKRQINKNISEMKELLLSYRDTTVLVTFSSLDYRNPKKNKYAYKIEPLQTEWIYLDNKNDIAITNLNPGTYTLNIKGSNSDGIWNKKEISLKIYVSPPFWKTVWFRGITLLFLFFIALGWHKNRLKKQEIKLRSEVYIEQFCIKHKITEREVEIIKLVLLGKTNKEMEDILFITAGTVKNHIYNIFKKLNVKNRTQLAGLLSDWKKVNKSE